MFGCIMGVGGLGEGMGEMPESLRGSSVNPLLVLTVINSIKPGSVTWGWGWCCDASYGPASGGQETVALRAGLKALA